MHFAIHDRVQSVLERLKYADLIYLVAELTKWLNSLIIEEMNSVKLHMHLPRFAKYKHDKLSYFRITRSVPLTTPRRSPLKPRFLCEVRRAIGVLGSLNWMKSRPFFGRYTPILVVVGYPAPIKTKITRCFKEENQRVL